LAAGAGPLNPLTRDDALISIGVEGSQIAVSWFDVSDPAAPLLASRVLGGAVVSISGRSFKSLDITDRDHPRLLAELALAWPVDIVHRVGDVFIRLDRGAGGYWDGGTSGPASLHASPVDDPDALLTSLELPGGRIAGSFLPGDSLYVAHLRMTQELMKDGIESSETFTTTMLLLSCACCPFPFSSPSFS
jgi:hypothetical protein